MAKLEDIKVGNVIAGIVKNETVSVTEVTNYGKSSISLKYKTSSGRIYYQMLFGESEKNIEIVDKPLPNNNNKHSE